MTTPALTPILRNQAVAAVSVYELQQYVKWLKDSNFAAPTIALGAAGAAGVATTWLRSDATIAAFDATVPTTQAMGDAAATGSAAFAARRDHVHGMPVFATIAFDATAPTTIAPDDAAAVGSAAYAARRDHVHAIVAAAASSLSVATTNAEGDATSFARSNHIHTVTTSANPGAAAAILATDASGLLQLVGLGIGAAPAAGAIALATAGYVGLGAAAGRIVFTDAATDSLDVTNANLRILGNSGNTMLQIGDSTLTEPYIYLYTNATMHEGLLATRSNHPLVIQANNAEVARFPAAGGFQVGTATGAGAGDIDVSGHYEVDGVQVVSNRVVDARCDDTINTAAWDATTAGVLDSLRDALISHGLLAAA